MKFLQLLQQTVLWIALLSCLLQGTSARNQNEETANSRFNVRAKRYALPKASKWSPKQLAGYNLTLKWFVSNYTNDMDNTATRIVIQRAFDIWESKSHIPQLPENQQVSLKFIEAKSVEEADINIRWEKGDHGDPLPFVTSTNEEVVAHNFYPGYTFPLNGDLHFNDNLKWSLTERDGYYYFPRAMVHEIGHALGLMHSHSSTAVTNMAYLHNNETDMNSMFLYSDDKCGVNWNVVGPSNWCLLVWISSEVLAIPSFRGSKNEKLWAVHQHINGSRYDHLPLCRDNNSVRDDVMILLHRQLQFNKDQTDFYARICCEIFDGVHRYRDMMAVTQDYASYYGPHRVYPRDELQRFIDAKPSDLKRSLYDEELFDAFFAEY